MVASVLLRAPTKNDNPGVSLSFDPAFALARSNKLFTLSNIPYVMAGFTVRTKPGLIPSQRPVTPSSRMISLATPRKESSLFSEDADRGSSEFRPTCCRVAITETGIVNI